MSFQLPPYHPSNYGGHSRGYLSERERKDAMLVGLAENLQGDEDKVAETLLLDANDEDFAESQTPFFSDYISRRLHNLDDYTMELQMSRQMDDASLSGSIDSGAFEYRGQNLGYHDDSLNDEAYNRHLRATASSLNLFQNKEEEVSLTGSADISILPIEESEDDRSMMSTPTLLNDGNSVHRMDSSTETKPHPRQSAGVFTPSLQTAVDLATALHSSPSLNQECDRSAVSHLSFVYMPFPRQDTDPFNTSEGESSGDEQWEDEQVVDMVDIDLTGDDNDGSMPERDLPEKTRGLEFIPPSSPCGTPTTQPMFWSDTDEDSSDEQEQWEDEHSASIHLNSVKDALNEDAAIRDQVRETQVLAAWNDRCPAQGGLGLIDALQPLGCSPNQMEASLQMDPCRSRADEEYGLESGNAMTKALSIYDGGKNSSFDVSSTEISMDGLEESDFFVGKGLAETHRRYMRISRVLQFGVLLLGLGLIALVCTVYFGRAKSPVIPLSICGAISTMKQGRFDLIFENATTSQLESGKEELKDLLLHAYNNASGRCDGLFQRILMNSSMEDAKPLDNPFGTLPLTRTSWTATVDCSGCPDDEPLFSDRLGRLRRLQNYDVDSHEILAQENNLLESNQMLDQFKESMNGQLSALDNTADANLVAIVTFSMSDGEVHQALKVLTPEPTMPPTPAPTTPAPTTMPSAAPSASACRVASLDLINPDTDATIGTLKDGDVIDWNELSRNGIWHIALEAITVPQKVNSVDFYINGNLATTEYHFRYSLGRGDAGLYSADALSIPTDNLTLRADCHIEVSPYDWRLASHEVTVKIVR